MVDVQAAGLKNYLAAFLAGVMIFFFHSTRNFIPIWRIHIEPRGNFIVNGYIVKAIEESMKRDDAQEIPGENASTEWCEPVDDAQYYLLV